MKTTETNNSVLLVDSNFKLTRSYQKHLSKKGFDISVTDNGFDTVDQILKNQPSIVILENVLAGIDGIEVCRRIQGSYLNPILMLATKADDRTKIFALETGADNYLNKPVSAKLLHAHIHALLRCCSKSHLENIEYRFQNLTINLQKLTLYKDGQQILLTAGEFEILAILVKKVDLLVTRKHLYQKIHNREYDESNRSLDVRIATLRKKLNDTKLPHRYIKTIRGKGYRLIS